MNCKKKRNEIIIRLLLILTTAVFFSASVYFAAESKEKANVFNSSSEELNSLESKKRILQTQIEELEIQNKQVKQQVDELKQEIEDIKQKYPDSNINLEEMKEKYAYLTFDDGPSSNTGKILDFLKANNIKATFFVVRKENSKEIYQRIINEGHTLAIHSNTHVYKSIYRNSEAFMKDIHSLSEFLEKETGVKPTVLRFPGGSNNTISWKYGGKEIMNEIIPKVLEKGYTYFDWNVDSRDAEKTQQKKEVIVRSVLAGAKYTNNAVILMHDAPKKTTTVEALPEIVSGLKKQGFIFKELTPESKPVKFK